MKIHTFTDNGGSIARGTLEVGGYQPSPRVYEVAVRAVTIDAAAVNKGGVFSVTTTGATEVVTLATDLPVGAEFLIVPTNGCLIEMESGTINNVGATQGATIASGSFAKILVVGAATFICTAVDALGADYNNGISQFIDLKFYAPRHIRFVGFVFVIEGNNILLK